MCVYQNRIQLPFSCHPMAFCPHLQVTRMSVRQLKAELAARDVEISHCRALDRPVGPKREWIGHGLRAGYR